MRVISEGQNLQGVEREMIQEQEERKKSTVQRLLAESNPYFKIGLLLLSLMLFTILLIDRYRQSKNTLIKIAALVLCGIMIQCLVNML
jgi:hypothetical protein